MSQIKSIGTAVPRFKHEQDELLQFMSRVYAFNGKEKRALKYLYHQSGIRTRYSVLGDYSQPPGNWTFYPPTENIEPFPGLEDRMRKFNRDAASLSAAAIRNCLTDQTAPESITHLITVTCTGLSAPGLDVQLIDLLGLPKNIFRSSVNFMGCYAAIHALKIADAICSAEPDANVLVVCTELCTLHFQQANTLDNITASLLFGDGSAAILITGEQDKSKGYSLLGFYGELIPEGRADMSWELSSTGFQMTLSGYIPRLIEADFETLVSRALKKNNISRDQITQWAIHPGGKRILEAIGKSLSLPAERFSASYQVLADYGNMSSPTILFVLKQILDSTDPRGVQKIFGAAFGPGLTMETFILGNRI